MGPAPHHPLLSVVVPHHRGTHFIGACLTSLRASVGVAYEVIVVTSATGEALEFLRTQPDIRLRWDQGGPAHKRNVGTAMAKGTYLIYLDDDTEVSPYTLYEFWRGFQELPQAGMLFARIYNGERREELDDCGSWLTWTGFLYARAAEGQGPKAGRRIRERIPDLMVPVRCLASKSAGCAIRREVFDDAGGFDAGYYILGEETDLAWRVWLRGHEVWYWPTATLWHWFNTGGKPARDWYTLERVHYRGVRNYLSLLWTSLGTLRLVAILPLHLAIWVGAILGFALRGQWARAGHLLRGIWDFCCHLPTAKRRRVQRTRVMSDRALWSHIAYHPHWTYYPKRLIRYVWNGLHG